MSDQANILLSGRQKTLRHFRAASSGIKSRQFDELVNCDVGSESAITNDQGLFVASTCAKSLDGAMKYERTLGYDD
jgi:hypothetical protein